MSQIIMPAGSVEERAQRIRNLGAECTIMEVIGMQIDYFHLLFLKITSFQLIKRLIIDLRLQFCLGKL